MVRDQDPDPTGSQIGNDLLQIQNCNRVNTRERLIQQNERGIDAERPRDFHPPPLPARQRIPTILPYMLQPELVNQLLRLFPALMPGNRLHFQHGQDVFLDRQLPKHRCFLREIADAILASPYVHGNAGDIFVVVQHPACIGRNQAHDGIECSGFSGAIRSQKAHDLSLQNLKADTVYNASATIGFPNFVGG